MREKKKISPEDITYLVMSEFYATVDDRSCLVVPRVERFTSLKAAREHAEAQPGGNDYLLFERIGICRSGPRSWDGPGERRGAGDG